jgi:NAD(P)-dependent dehydrogenase (short-subunit alcohol dehydrogenase family)
VTRREFDVGRRTIIITGAARGIGRACALRQAAEGDHVVAWDVTGDAANAVADEVKASGGSAEWAAVDIADTSATRAGVSAIQASRGSVDGLISAAGLMRTLPIDEIDEQEWDRILNVNLRGTMFLAQKVAQTIRHGGGSGAIVLFSSVAGRKGRSLAAHYAASKAATISLTQSMAMAYGPTVRVNSICPGVIATPMQDQIAQEREQILGSSADAHYQGLVQSIALKRVGDPDEVAKVAQFLMGPLADYVTGQAINVDGGLEFH